MNNHKTMVGLAPAKQSVLLSRPVRIERDPFRGAPIGESRRQRQCIVQAIRVCVSDEPAPRDDDAELHNAILAHLRSMKAQAKAEGDRSAELYWARRIGDVVNG